MCFPSYATSPQALNRYLSYLHPPQAKSLEGWIVSRDKTTTALTLASATSPKHEQGIHSRSYDRLLHSTRINDVCLISAKRLCSKMLVGPIADEEMSPLFSLTPYIFSQYAQAASWRSSSVPRDTNASTLLAGVSLFCCCCCCCCNCCCCCYAKIQFVSPPSCD